MLLWFGYGASISAKELVKLVHDSGKQAMMFLGDNWIGTEPYGKYFGEIGLDAVVGSVVGVGEPTACEYGGHFLQLADAFGIDKELGFTLSTDKYFVKQREEYFIAKEGYMNFEMNANSALLSGFGVKPNRKRIRDLTDLRASCDVRIDENSWNAVLKVPMELICDIYNIKPLGKGDSFTCNFYKICEDPSIEHYASFSPINNPTPNFHLPQFFAKAIIK